MRQTFTDIPARSLPRRLARLGRRGWTALAAGVLIVTLLLIGNLAVLFGANRLQQTDAAYRQPPHWLLFQRLLYTPPLEITPYVDPSRSGSFNTLLDAPPQEQETATVPPFTITSAPRFTAVVGRPYRYQIRVDSAREDIRYRLLAAPAGMMIDTLGQITWTPEPIQASGRSHIVEVAAFGPAGEGAQQRYPLIVSERPHPLGTDEAGRDIGAALLLGTRWTVLPGVVAVAVSLLLGLLVGGLAGYYEGRIDALLSYLARLSETVPALLLLFLAAVIFRYQLYPVMAVLGFLLFPGVARGVKTHVLTLKAAQFIEASREIGLTDAEILWKDIIWHNARPFLLARVFYGLALAVVTEVTLSYLNIGILPPTVSWGTMIQEGRGLIGTHQYWLAFFPALATLLAAAGYYLLGSGLEKQFRIKRM